MSREERSIRMSKIQSKWTTPERTVHNFLKGNKIKHKMHPNIGGNPDIKLTNSKKVIFIQGCFWHKCPKCYKEPKSNKRYWVTKINKNVKRDVKNRKELKKNGYNVIEIWEHEVSKSRGRCLNKIIKCY